MHDLTSLEHGERNMAGSETEYLADRLEELERELTPADSGDPPPIKAYDAPENLPDTSEADAWGVAQGLFPRLPFPWEVFPESIAGSLQRLGRACATSPVGLAGAAVAVFASLLGRTVEVSPKPGWVEPLSFWFADVRPSGAGKTPAARELCHVLYRSQAAVDRHYQAELEQWETKTSKERGPAPRRARGYFITELTLEGLRADLSAHGGVVCILDELSGFLSGQNQYKRGHGNDRESWLSIWDGKPARVVRANKSLTIDGARVSIFGGIQPKVWSKCFGGDDGLFIEDGTVYRFLPTLEGNTFYELTNESWSDENRATWERLLATAMRWADTWASGDDWKPKRLVLNEEALAIFLKWRNDILFQADTLPGLFAGFPAKAVSYSLRFSGLFHCLERFQAELEPAGIITAQSMNKGIEAASFYLGHALEAVRALSSEKTVAPIENDWQIRLLKETLAAMRDNIENGRLPVSSILERFNAIAGPQWQIDRPRTMATMLRQCGLTIPAKTYRVGDKVAVTCLLWDSKAEDFVRIPSTFSTSSTKQEPRAFCGVEKGKPISTSSTDRAGHVENVENKNPFSTCEDPRQSRLVENVENVENVEHLGAQRRPSKRTVEI